MILNNKKRRVVINVILLLLICLSLAILSYINYRRTLDDEIVKLKEVSLIKSDVSNLNKATEKNFDEYGNVMNLEESKDSEAIVLPSITQYDNCNDIKDLKITNDNKNILPILMYHHIGNSSNPNTSKRPDILEVETKDFDAQMKYLSDNQYNTIDMPTWVHYYQCGYPSPTKTVILTFDDGYKDFITDALPILKKYNLTSEVFLISGLLNKQYYMSWDDAKELIKTNLVTIGSHTVNHPKLNTLKGQALLDEIVNSKKNLEETLQIKILDFCFPYGVFNDDVQYKVRDNGYQLALTTDYFRLKWNGDMYKIPRIQVSYFTTLNNFKLMLM